MPKGAPKQPPGGGGEIGGIRRYCLYRRVSSDDQLDKDLSLPAQRRLQHEYVTRAGGAVVAEYEDGGVSGTRAENRAQFQEAIALARRGECDALLIHKSDRVFRNRFDAVTYKVLLRESGAALESVTEPWVGGDEPGERLLEGVMECVNEFYSLNLSRETKKGLDQIALAKGRQGGQAPYGYRYVNIEVKGSGWEPDDADGLGNGEAVWVRRIFARVLEGATPADVSRELNAAGVPTARSRPRGHSEAARAGLFWGPATVRYLLRNRVYAGQVLRAGVWHPGAHAPLVEPSEFDAVQGALRRRPPGRAGAAGRGIFAGGLARCPLCGDTLMHLAKKVYTGTKERGGEEYNSRYVCRSAYRSRRAKTVGAEKEGCAGFYISQKALRRLLIALLRNQVSSAPAHRAGSVPHPAPTSPAPRSHLTGPRLIETERAGIVGQLGKLDRMRQGFLDLAAEGLMRVDELRGRLEDLERRRADAEALLAALAEPVRQAALTTDQAGGLLAVLEDPDATAPRQREALRLSIDYVVPWPSREGLDLYLFF